LCRRTTKLPAAEFSRIIVQEHSLEFSIRAATTPEFSTQTLNSLPKAGNIQDFFSGIFINRKQIKTEISADQTQNYIINH
jgi:hypothetical protein